MTDASIKDVAARAGVAIGTVSNVLNRPEVVRPATRERVERAIADLGYVPNGSARQLKAGRSSVVAYVTLDAGNPFFADVARGADEMLRRYGLSLFVCDTGQDAVREHDYLRHLAELRVRGVLITAVDLGNPGLDLLRRRGIPVVLLDRVLEPSGDQPWCAVGVDDVLGGDLAIEHLIDRGHRRLCFVGGPESIPQVADRHAGAARAVARQNLPADSLTWVPTVGLNFADGRQAGQKLLGIPARSRPTAVFCANDLVAVGLLQQLTQAGVRVPDDIALVGYDDIEYAAAAAVPISSVAQPRQKLGQAAVELLQEAAEHGDDHAHRQVVFRPELVVRASSLGHG